MYGETGWSMSHAGYLQKGCVGPWLSWDFRLRSKRGRASNLFASSFLSTVWLVRVHLGGINKTPDPTRQSSKKAEPVSVQVIRPGPWSHCDSFWDKHDGRHAEAKFLPPRGRGDDPRGSRDTCVKEPVLKQNQYLQYLATIQCRV